VIAAAGVGHCVKTWAWLLTLRREEHRVSFWRLFQLRLVSEAAGQFGVLGQLFGDGLRVTALGKEISVASRISSVTIDRGLFIVTGAVVTLAGIVAAPFRLAVSSAWRTYGSLFALALLGLLATAALALHRRWPIITGSARFAGKAGLGRWLQGREQQIESAESKIFEYHRDAPGAFWASVSLNLVSHALAIFEVYLILRILGAGISPLDALILEALTKLVNVVGLFNPGNVGSYEGGNVLLAKLFGLSATTGLVVAVARRIRALFWAAAGAVCFFTMTRNKRDDVMSKGIRSSSQTRLTLVPKNASASNPDGLSKAAIILADDLRRGRLVRPMLSQVGALPVMLRNILSIRKAGVERIFIYADPINGPQLRRELMNSARMPDGVEWLDAVASESSLCDVLNHLAPRGYDHILLFAGDTVYHPALFREVVRWNHEDEVLAFTSNGKPIGIFAVPAKIAEDIAACGDATAGGTDNPALPLLAQCSVQYKEAHEDQWQKVCNEEDRIAAERKLDGWLTKPTDGVFARFNRRISIPISRQLIKFPITPNMVSLFTLGVGFLSGVFFAMGHYWSTVFAALLSLFASILDGSDGEVARLKLLESDFGCWLETVCDYLYYIFIFSGMAIGAVRASGPKYVLCGVLLLFGAVATILITGFGRNLFARERPDQYLAVWQAKAEKSKKNPILYFGRYTEFMIRRCFVPYPILVFALFGLTNVLIILATFGANCAWIISLYSMRTLIGRPPAPVSSGPCLETETCTGR